MKNCNEIREMLSFYLENEIHENDRKEVVKHIENCQECKSELEQYKDIMEYLGELEEVELPINFGQKLHAKLVEASKEFEVPKKFQWNKVYRWASAAVAGFAVLFVALSGGFSHLYQAPSKNAYVADAKLDTVDKTVMDATSAKREIANNENNKQKAVTADVYNASIKAQSTTAEAPRAKIAPKQSGTQGAALAKSATSPDEPVSSASIMTAQDSANTTEPVGEPKMGIAALTLPNDNQEVNISINVENIDKTLDTIKEYLNSKGTITEINEPDASAKRFSIATESKYTVEISKSFEKEFISRLSKLGTVVSESGESGAAENGESIARESRIILTLTQK